MNDTTTRDSNPDPITGAPGSHPVGVGLGGTSGAVVGAAIGSLLGPIGTLIRGAAGTIAGAQIRGLACGGNGAKPATDTGAADRSLTPAGLMGAIAVAGFPVMPGWATVAE